MSCGREGDHHENSSEDLPPLSRSQRCRRQALLVLRAYHGAALQRGSLLAPSRWARGHPGQRRVRPARARRQPVMKLTSDEFLFLEDALRKFKHGSTVYVTPFSHLEAVLHE